MNLRAAAMILAGLSSCTPLPESYPVPVQRGMENGPEPEPLRASISFDDPRLKDYLIGGFLEAGPGQTWRWAGEKPEVRLRLEALAGLRLRARFTFPHESHGPLMPITVRVFVNEKLLGAQIYRKPGELEFVKDAAEELLVAGENRVRLEADRVYVAKADGVRLGMILTEIGFQARR
ncbi:MAG: hypothetical protein FJW30_12275 [Acidobacteria bacterium]|nr:hypothetical protein [Acidobacteriota bacterium]